MRWKEERKYKDVKTTEILDYVAQEIPYEKDKERDKQEDYKNELEDRKPFSDIKRKIEQMDKQLRNLQDVVTKLTSHKHDGQGEVVIPISKAIYERY